MSSLRKAKSEVRGYRAVEIDGIWPIAKPLIQKALDMGSNYSIDEIYMGLRRKEMQLWGWGHDAFLVTAIQSRDDDKTWCLLLAVGGKDMDLWLPYFPQLEAWAKAQGCAEMRLYGRIGWARVIGYDVAWTKMVKKL